MALTDKQRILRLERSILALIDLLPRIGPELQAIREDVESKEKK